MPRDWFVDRQTQPGGQATLPPQMEEATRTRRVDGGGTFEDEVHRHTQDLLLPRALRCGVPDRRPGDLRPTAYGSPGDRWSRGNLTYTVSAMGATGVTPAQVDAQVRAAVTQWQAAQPFFSLRQVAGPAADIRIRFGGPALDPSFGAAGGVAGSARSPESGDVFLDSAEVWTEAVLLAVVLH